MKEDGSIDRKFKIKRELLEKLIQKKLSLFNLMMDFKSLLVKISFH